MFFDFLPRVSKAGAPHRLSDIDTQFVSLVRAGANRQTQFQVVKSDDPPDAGDVPPEGSPSGDQGAGGEPAGSGGASTVELDAWLGRTSERVSVLATEARLKQILSAYEPSPPTQAVQAQMFGKRDDAPSQGHEGLAAELRKEMSDLRTETAVTVGKLQGELASTSKQLRAERAKLAKFRNSTVGGSTALVTGEVKPGSGGTRKGDEGVDEEGRKVWKSGGDLARKSRG